VGTILCPTIPNCESVERYARELDNQVTPSFGQLHARINLWLVCARGSVVFIARSCALRSLLRRVRKSADGDKADKSIIECYRATVRALTMLEECPRVSLWMAPPRVLVRGMAAQLRRYLDEAALAIAAGKVVDCLNQLEIDPARAHVLDA